MTNTDVRAVLFDWDGTIVDSLGTILGAMGRAFAAHDLPPPDRAVLRELIGLRLDEIMVALHPTGSAGEQSALVESYRHFFHAAMDDPELAEDLFPGAREGLARLDAAGFRLGVVTGKSLRGLRHALARYELESVFLTLQTPDDNPGKPHPGMVWRALDELGMGPAQAVVVGDTAFDLQMARSAGVTALGVAWGNHSPAELRAAGAEEVFEDFGALVSWLRC